MSTDLLSLWTELRIPYVVALAEDLTDFAEEMRYMRQFLSPGELGGLAERLGVSRDSLDAIGAAWSGKYCAWAFPMRDGEGEIVGVRLRSEDGSKWAITGSRQGLFYDADMLTSEGDKILYVTEGPTDTAAVLTLGLPAAGRASCNGQAEQIFILCKARGFRRFVVIADNDTAKEKRDGTAFYPGREGAEKMAKEVGLPFKMILPPAKDIRAWVNEGATAATLATLERQMIWRK